MRLLKSRNAAQEEITSVLNEGYSLLSRMNIDRDTKMKNSIWLPTVAKTEHEKLINEWGASVQRTLLEIFPTERERNLFLNPLQHGLAAIAADDQDDYKWQSMRLRLKDLIGALDIILENRLNGYTDVPIQKRFYVEDIDSFSKVRDINPGAVEHNIKKGYLDISEEEVQLLLEKILNESLHKKDWGGEQNDLYSSNMLVNGRRMSAAFLLKGNGLRKNLMQIANCGANGDQIIRLATSPADVLVVQFVGNISEAVITDIESKIDQARAQGKERWYCVINGQDTARLLKAYS